MSRTSLRYTSLLLLLVPFVWGSDMAAGTDELNAALQANLRQHARHPKQTIYIHQIADLYTQQDNADSALYFWQLLAELEPNNDSCYYMASTFLLAKGETNSASDMIQHALAIKPQAVPYLNTYAGILYKQQKEDSAATVCEQILSITPSHVDALLLSGIIYSHQRKYDNALEKFDRCLQVAPNNTEALLRRADIYVALNKYNAALTDYTAARADETSNADIYNNIGICYYQSGDYHKAIDYFKKALFVDHLHPQSYFNKGLSYYHLQHFDAATIDLKKAGAIWDTCYSDTCHAYFQDAMYYLGVCYKKVGDLETAKKHFLLLQKEGYHKDLSGDIKRIDYALFIAQYWYYFILLGVLGIALIIALYKWIRK